MATEKELSKWDERLPIPYLSKKWIRILIASSAVVSYYNSLDGDFVFDDSEAIVNNGDIKSTTPIANIIYNDFWGTSLMNEASHKSYRPITVLSFRMIAWASGELNSKTFHLVNVILHMIVSLLTFQVYDKFCHGHCLKTCTICSFLFAVHPIHTEAVAGIVGQAELLSSIFGFCGFLVYSRACYFNDFFSVFLYTTINCIFCIAAMLSKEQGICIVGICVIYDVLMSNDMKSSHFKWSNFSTNFKIRIFLMSLFTGLALYMRWAIMGFKAPQFLPMDNPASFLDSFVLRVINYNYIHVLNIWLLICPDWLCYDWSMGCVPLIVSFKDLRILIVVMYWSFVTLLFTSTLKQDIVTQRMIVISVCSTVVLFLPASNMLLTVGFVVAERVLYLPSFAFILLFVTGLQRLSVFYNSNKILRSLLGLLLITYLLRSIQRTLDWKTEMSLYESALRVCPLNAKVHYNVAKTASVNGQLELAEREYRQAIILKEDYDQAMNNLANLLREKGELNEAKSLLKKTVQIKPDLAAAWMNLGIVLSGLKEYAEAEKCYLNALKYRKVYPECHYNLGNLYLDTNRKEEAYNAWNYSIMLKAKQKSPWTNMIVMLESNGEYEKALTVAQLALSHLPMESTIHFLIANILGKLGKYTDSEKNFKKAIELNGKQAIYHTNLGVLYHRWKKYCKAKEAYGSALHLEPLSKSIKEKLLSLVATYNVAKYC